MRDAFGFAAPTVTVLSPKSASASGSPVFYEAYATSPACASGISAMRIYTAPGVNAYTVNGAHIETFITLAAGSYSTVVQAWDNCGGVAKTPVNITVKNTAGVSVFFADERSCKHSSPSGGISTKSGVLCWQDFDLRPLGLKILRRLSANPAPVAAFQRGGYRRYNKIS